MSEYIYPTFDEFIKLALLSVLLCAAGGLLLAWRRDKGPNGAPLWLTIVVTVIIGVIYISGAWYLVENALDSRRRPTIIVYSLAFWIIPLAFYTRLVMNALATTTVDKLSWLDVRIGDISEFTMARDLAGRGDIDGAVRIYRNYSKNKLGALKEAAQLLHMNGRTKDALGVYQEIVERFADNRPAVAEVLFRMAKIQENELGDGQLAQALYRRIYVQTPESDWGKQSAQALRTNLGSGDSLLAALDAGYSGRDPETSPRMSPGPDPAAPITPAADNR